MTNSTRIKITPRAYPLADIVDPRNLEATTALQTEINRELALAHAAPELLRHLKGLCFIVESMAHLTGREADLLPLTDAARAVINQFPNN
jgi:hypothetical protein